MKRICILIVVGAAFLGGYYLGRLPASPDLIGWGKRTIDQTAIVVGQVIDTLEDWSGPPPQQPGPVGQVDDERIEPIAPSQ